MLLRSRVTMGALQEIGCEIKVHCFIVLLLLVRL